MIEQATKAILTDYHVIDEEESSKEKVERIEDVLAPHFASSAEICQILTELNESKVREPRSSAESRLSISTIASLSSDHAPSSKEAPSRQGTASTIDTKTSSRTQIKYAFFAMSC